MEIKEFRIAHSTLIEHYQFMEAHLEGLYAAISGKPFREGVEEVEKDSLGGVLREIRRVEKEKGLAIFTREEYEQLQAVFARRNYWCHCCYFEMPFDRKTGGPAKVRDVQQMMADMQQALQWRERLFHIKIEFLKQANMLESQIPHSPPRLL